ncbi:hypothetical protein [Halopiger djelfimassiliensis]|uniref:hypothetical protein n=1 Tax=Halopiger djelfimassiliensis TaxID=1293047 RepID=UPI000677DBF8|nr:hypothetical protein [Halopiger djelfimassiliensis]
MLPIALGGAKAGASAIRPLAALVLALAILDVTGIVPFEMWFTWAWQLLVALFERLAAEALGLSAYPAGGGL